MKVIKYIFECLDIDKSGQLVDSVLNIEGAAPVLGFWLGDSSFRVTIREITDKTDKYDAKNYMELLKASNVEGLEISENEKEYIVINKKRANFFVTKSIFVFKDESTCL